MEEMFRDYSVIKAPAGKQWFIYWRDSYLEDGELLWADGGFKSGDHRSLEAAQARCDELNAQVPERLRPPTPTKEGQSQ